MEILKCPFSREMWKVRRCVYFSGTVLTPPASKFGSLRKVPPAQAISAMTSPLVRNVAPAGL